MTWFTQQNKYMVPCPKRTHNLKKMLKNHQETAIITDDILGDGRINVRYG